MSKQQQIAKEAGMSFESVVRWYANNGESITATAELLGYAVTAFRRLCIRHGWQDWFRHGSASNGFQRSIQARTGVDTPRKQEARNKVKYETITYRGINDTWAGHARRLGLSPRTVYKRKYRKPSDLDYIFSTRSHVKPPGTKGHIWRDAL